MGKWTFANWLTPTWCRFSATCLPDKCVTSFTVTKHTFPPQPLYQCDDRWRSIPFWHAGWTQQARSWPFETYTHPVHNYVFEGVCNHKLLAMGSIIGSSIRSTFIQLLIDDVSAILKWPSWMKKISAWRCFNAACTEASEQSADWVECADVCGESECAAGCGLEPDEGVPRCSERDTARCCKQAAAARDSVEHNSGKECQRRRSSTFISSFLFLSFSVCQRCGMNTKGIPYIPDSQIP
jgi:hypothetical protein